LVGPSGHATDQNEFRARLLREARAMAQLRHPNVVAVYEVGEHRGHVFLAMELLAGGTLGAEIRRLRAAGAPDWRRVVALFTGAARGLIAAHDAGMVHRDFKPDNVLIDRDGRVAVADFGLVGDFGAREPADEGDADVPIGEPLTRSSIVVGTPAYMAPEQQIGQPLDARADQFAFCAALYEALHGQLPFPGRTRNEYLDAVKTGALRSAPGDSRVPAWLDEVLARGLAHDPQDRWPSMQALVGELGVDPASERRAGHVERAVGMATVGGFLCVVLLAALLFDIELSYRLHYLTDAGFLLLAVVFGWISRETLVRSRFNRRLFQLAASGGVGVLGMTAGGQVLGLSPDTVAAIHLYVIASFALAGAAFERPLALIAANYFVAFFVVARWPALFIPVSMIAHTLLAILAIGLFWPRGGRGER
ncbi:MAG TPA: serine/threonine-protein kinase, partial [Kofleriaceae bacterium]|nr:serine/threonine-protein kinase [Kofleriaceae bacterium]